MCAQSLQISDQMFGGVVDQTGRWRRPAGAALIEQDDAPVLRIKKTAQMRRAATAGTAMQYHHRPPGRVATLLHIQGMAVINRKLELLTR